MIEFPIFEIQKLLRSRKISILELCENFIIQINKEESRIKAWEFLNIDQIYSEAKKLDSKYDEFKNKNLFGIPIGIKDVFNTVDYPTEMGSQIWKGYTPGNDARVVHNCREEKAVIFGKTVTAEFAVNYLSAEKTKNPINLNYIPGTSSSGSAAAVASKMVPIALGTQTAGSIIRPASFCGVIGFKPSFGLIPRTGILKTNDTLDTVGCFANFIDDIKVLFQTLHVKGSDYPIANTKLNPNFLIEKDKKIKIGIIDEGLSIFNNYPAYSTECFQTFIQKISNFNNLSTERVDIDEEWNQIHKIHATIYDSSLGYYFKNEFENKKIHLSKVISDAIEKGKKITKEQYQLAINNQSQIRQKLEPIIEQFDIILSLSTAGIAPKIGEDEIPDMCLIWTFLGNPSLSLPLFNGPDHMPFGLQISAPRFKDYELIEFSKLIYQMK